MGIHEVAVRLGLSYTSNKEAELKLAKFIEIKFRLAAEEFKKYINKRRRKFTFLDCLREVWRENNGEYSFVVSDSFIEKYFPDLCRAPIQISDKFEAEISYTFHNGTGTFNGMAFSAASLENSKDEKELRHNLTKVIAAVYHECDHIYFRPKASFFNKFEEYLKYQLDEAETRAKSKAFAYVYYKAFPRQKFNYKTLRSYIETHFKRGETIFDNLRILELMRDPAKFKTTKEDEKFYIKNRILTGGHPITITLLRNSFVKHMNYITYFVQRFNSEKS